MTRFRLVTRSLTHYWRTNVAVLLGVVAATAVIGGALVVGDSVRDSLRQMSLERLGGVDHALVAQRFFRQQLAEELEGQTAAEVAPAIVVQGSVVHEAGDEVSRAAGVSVYAADQRLWQIWQRSRAGEVVKRHTTGEPGPDEIGRVTGELLADVTADIAAPEATQVAVNRRLADQLGVETGDEVSLLIEIPAAIPRDALLGDRNETVTQLPLTVAFIAEDESTAGRFGLNPAQQLPLNAFVSLETLQRQLGMQQVPVSRRNPREKPARINALFVDTDTSAAEMTQSLDTLLTLDDLSLRLVPHEEQGYVSLESEQMILDDSIGDVAALVAKDLDLVASPVLVYLLDEVTSAADPDRFAMYSVVAGIEFDKPTPFGPLEFVAGGPPGQPGEVVINNWLAEDLGISQPGEKVVATHKVVGDRGQLPEVERTWTVSGILKLQGPAADPHYTPYVEGITDAETFGDWRQPYPMHLDRVTDRDEQYWDEYKTTPKLFLTLDTAQELFASRYGKLTSFRWAAGHDRALVEVADEFRERLLALLTGQQPRFVPQQRRAGQSMNIAIMRSLRVTGMEFQPVREQGLEAASGTTDFTGLFVGFSFFLIAAALLLIGLLVRLGLERRVSEYGLLSAVGLSPREVRRGFLGEIAAIVLIGGLLGSLAAVGYAWLMVYGLKTWWFGAIGTKFLDVFVQPLSLLSGFVIAVGMSLVTCWWTLWRMRDVSTRQMLAGLSEPPLSAVAQSARGRRARTTAIAGGGMASVLLAATLAGLVPASEAFSGFNWRVVSFFVVGVSLLVASLSLLAWWLDASEVAESSTVGLRGMLTLGLRNASRHRGRSVLTASLIASATFVIVAVAAGRRNPSSEVPINKSGNGGFVLLAESSTPILYDLNSPQGRADAGLDSTSRLLSAMRVFPFRVRPGEDASCLNLYQTRLPRILGVPDDVLNAMIEQERFRFADTPGEHPWALLRENLPHARIPVLGDMNTLLYSLHKGMGDEIEVPSDSSTTQPAGGPTDAPTDGTAQANRASLEVVGMLDGSVFQGLLLMSETNFLRLFPDRAGFSYFLIETDPSQADELARLLETRLADYGFDVTPVAQRLAEFLAVQNTYLSTFQTLGGLGLLLGTLGLGTVMLRNVLERRGELALLRAVGFRGTQIRRMVLAENAFLLLWGLAAGSLSALLAMSPHLMTTGANVPWLGLEAMLLGVFCMGMLAALLAVREAARTPILATLRAE